MLNSMFMLLSLEWPPRSPVLLLFAEFGTSLRILNTALQEVADK